MIENEAPPANWFQTQQALGRGWRKLTEPRVRNIKRRLRAGDTGAQIARDEGIGPSTVHDIKTGRNWAWVQL